MNLYWARPFSPPSSRYSSRCTETRRTSQNGLRLHGNSALSQQTSSLIRLRSRGVVIRAPLTSSKVVRKVVISAGSGVSRDSLIITPALRVFAVNSSTTSMLAFSRNEARFLLKHLFSNSRRGREIALSGKSHWRALWALRTSSETGDDSKVSKITLSLRSRIAWN